MMMMMMIMMMVMTINNNNNNSDDDVQFLYFFFSGENMLHVNDTDSGIVIVTTRQNLEYLATPDVQIFSDGTFQYCPRFFLQMYTLVGYSNGQYIPCVIALLPSKSRETYRRMFQHISDIARWLKDIFGIMFLPPHQIEEYFVFELMAEKPENEKMDELMDYLLETDKSRGRLEEEERGKVREIDGQAEKMQKRPRG
ncbi:hypothetical protein ElyMa_000715000 [Elysia marginata]|uniref:MULE transposase domain-containing protein n=1 Tax=Elysia marginata TaxID=1093978 RepID=A0AAV4GMT9_9GAST|nr:hypothetical protein ElyMa_000715000 [Elysia marginata]